jgi:L-ascorbate metabolism protein UlaG (beta-lactamase superfamily)
MLMKKKRVKGSRSTLQITWFGHSAFLLEPPRGPTVLIDPWLDNPRAPAGAKDLPRVDVILVTHGHSDHVGNTVEVARRTGAKVISIFELFLHFQALGVQTAEGMNKGGTIVLDGLKATMVDARHSSDIDVDGKVTAGGEPAGFVVAFEDGFTVYHAGDTALFGDMKFIGQLHAPTVALLPIGGLYTMAPREAAVACTLIRPSYIIGMHYGTFPVLTGTPAELRRHLPVNMRKRVRELVPGTPVTLSS